MRHEAEHQQAKMEYLVRLWAIRGLTEKDFESMLRLVRPFAKRTHQSLDEALTQILYEAIDQVH